MIAACGFDHAAGYVGYVLRERLLGKVTAAGHKVLDFGTDRPDPRRRASVDQIERTAGDVVFEEAS